jgi:peptide/nickel transport system permease protein
MAVQTLEKEKPEFQAIKTIKPKSEWQIAFRQLKKNKLAVFGFWVLIFLYFLMVFADFISPYSQTFADHLKSYMPPVAIHFFDQQGKFHLDPFIYNYVEKPEYSGHYIPITSRIYPIHFFYTAPGAKTHYLLGFIPMKMRLFGVSPPARIYLFGSGRLGRDIFSRILYGSRISLTIGLFGVLISYSFGMLIGGISGFYAGKPIKLGIWWEISLLLIGSGIGLYTGMKHHEIALYSRNGALTGLAAAFIVRIILISASYLSHSENWWNPLNIPIYLFKIRNWKPSIDIDNWIQRFGEMLMTIPSLYLLLALRAVIPENISSVDVYFMIIFIIAFISWPFIARIVRGMVLSLREREYVMAAEGIGCSNLRTIVRHIIPNTFSQIIVLMTLSIPNYILLEAFLSFLDLGIQQPRASWGNMLTEAQNVVALIHYPWILLPGFLIVITVLAFNLLGDGLRDAFDPKMRR